ncbi:DNA topoisomerase [Clostridia bacterium]|nr:DNA topoisomerase [Clostridia bacterium]
MSILVISEKPSVGNAIANALGVIGGKNNGYIENNGYIISWCRGHLLESAAPEVYGEKYKKWRYGDLPIFPNDWKYVPSSGGEKQLDILTTLLNRADVEYIVNACDAGREGEHIFRLVYSHAKCRKPVKRLWVSSMEENAITAAFANLKPSADYDNLCRAAVCREHADWLIGMNQSRLWSIVYDGNFNVGRVQTPTLNMIVERENDIANFVKNPFYYAEVQFDGFTAVSKKFDDKNIANETVNNFLANPIKFVSVEKKEKSAAPPKLYDLTTLQRESNRFFGYTAAQTLEYTQSLYEKKLATYPRTDSRYLTDDMGEKASLILCILGSMREFGEYVPECMNIRNVLKSAAVSDHPAIIPTEFIGSFNLSTLPTGEHNILTLIAFRLISAVCGKFTYEETTVTLDCGGTILKAHGKNVINEGWKKVDGREKNEEDKFLPSIAENAVLTANSAIVKEGATSPKSHYTDDTLLSAMETAGDKINKTAENDMSVIVDKSLGTPATRAGVIEKLIKSEYVVRDKKNLLPTEKAKMLIAVLPENVKSPQMTAEWETKLKAVERGELPPDKFIDGIKAEIAANIKDNNFIKAGTTVGKCPVCGGEVYENKYGFFCRNLRCNFAMFKNSKFWTEKRIVLTADIAAKLLGTGQIYLENLFSGRTQKYYSATIKMTAGADGKIDYKMEFGKKGGAKNA